MALFLAQHGKSQPKDVDPKQGLSPIGTEEVERVAALAREQRLRIGRVVHSTKKRARQTAEIFAAALEPAGGILEQEGLKPMDDPVAFTATIKEQEDLLVVGHLPFMEKLVAYLVTGAMEPLVLKFINGAVVCLDKEPAGDRWFIRWTIVPRLA